MGLVKDICELILSKAGFAIVRTDEIEVKAPVAAARKKFSRKDPVTIETLSRLDGPNVRPLHVAPDMKIFTLNGSFTGEIYNQNATNTGRYVAMRGGTATYWENSLGASMTFYPHASNGNADMALEICNKAGERIDVVPLHGSKKKLQAKVNIADGRRFDKEIEWLTNNHWVAPQLVFKGYFRWNDVDNQYKNANVDVTYKVTFVICDWGWVFEDEDGWVFPKGNDQAASKGLDMVPITSVDLDEEVYVGDLLQAALARVTKMKENRDAALKTMPSGAVPDPILNNDPQDDDAHEDDSPASGFKVDFDDSMGS